MPLSPPPVTCAAARGGYAFDLIGAGAFASPCVLSVPHAGRCYPQSLLAALSVPAAALVTLEDRHVDAVAIAARRDEALLIQRHGRAWIDLNRAEHERDPAVDEGADPASSAIGSIKLRSGLGLVPRRAGRSDRLWRRRFTADEIETRIADDHRPYHRALADTLAVSRARFGTAVLIDLHSMPPLGVDARGRPGAQIVIGDRHGSTAAARFTSCARTMLGRFGWRVACNAPYAGGHIIASHGRPAQNIHALQIEIDRSLYLDANLDRPNAGLTQVAKAIRSLCDALMTEAMNGEATEGVTTDDTTMAAE